MMMTQEEFVNQFAENLRILIRREGITQKELAKECGMSVNSLRGYISDRPTVVPSAYTVYKLSVVFGCDADELLL